MCDLLEIGDLRFTGSRPNQFSAHTAEDMPHLLQPSRLAPFLTPLTPLSKSSNKMEEDRSRLVLLKLGGSLISDKTRPEALRGEVLDRIARCV